MLHSTPTGDRAVKTQGSAAPGSKDLLKEKPCAEAGSARTSLLILLSIFSCAAFIMFLVYKNFPQLRFLCIAPAVLELTSVDQAGLELRNPPASASQVLGLQGRESEYEDGFSCSGLGASFCYMLSYLVGRPVVYKYLTEKAVKWSQQVERHREHLINYIIFLRITPFLPNWFINITSPVINVPLKVFFIGTFLGVAPPSFVAIKAGTTLYQLTTAGEAVSWNSVFILMILALLSILPAIFQKKLKQKFE
ncbi:Transmembrane protein 41B [Apodemus speciosus]|uniref:Transmembrane protein 41B n=1 Tax=Apodemus speciosus TaxID=105296 RepID=A0ABQ0F0F1_APOSI